MGSYTSCASHFAILTFICAIIQGLQSSYLIQPSETDLIKERLIILAASESTTEERLSALRGLQDLVAPLDNANDLRVWIIISYTSHDQHAICNSRRCCFRYV